MDCIFCDIINGKAKSEIIYQSEKVIAFLDINPLTYGHTLVVPKIHCKNLLEIPGDYFSEIMESIQIISKGLVNSFTLEGFNVVSNNGKAAGQSVFHSHFHIIPRFADDGHKVRLNLKKYKDNEMKFYVDKIRQSIQQVE